MVRPSAEESSKPKTTVSRKKYVPPRIQTVKSWRGFFFRSARTASRARVTVAKGRERVPGLLSLPAGET